MRKYRRRISRELKERHLPAELLALPVVESCYVNAPSKRAWGTGLWMLVRRTAKDRGLRINGKVDERLNVDRSTEVALDYVKELHRDFRDWRLTLLAYNVGQFKVRRWRREGQLPEVQGYVAKITAVAIIMRERGLI